MGFNCSRCDKDMLGPVVDSGFLTDTGAPVAARMALPGFSFELVLSPEESEEKKLYTQQQLGPYQANKSYTLCMECTLLKMGILP